MATFSLGTSSGTFQFITLESLSGRGGAPQLPQTHTEIVQRPGVTGTGFVDMASKGDVFQMRSVVDVSTESEAQTLLAAYRSHVGKTLLSMIWRDVDYATVHNVKYVPVGITDDRLQVMANITGGLFVNDGYPGIIVEAIWHLVPVETE